MTLIIVLLVLGVILILLETFLPGLITGILGFLEPRESDLIDQSAVG